MTGRKLSSSGSSLPAPKKQHQKDQSSNPTTGGNSRRSTQRRTSMNSSTKAKDAAISTTKTTKNFNRRRGSTSAKSDEAPAKENTAIASDEEDNELMKMETPPGCNSHIDVLSDEEKRFEMVKILKIFNENENIHEERLPMKSVLRLVKRCSEPFRGSVDSMSEFPSCCFGLISIEETEGDNYNTVQIIGLGLRLRELL